MKTYQLGALAQEKTAFVHLRMLRFKYQLMIGKQENQVAKIMGITISTIFIE